MNINLSGITKGIERNAEKLSTLFGYYSTVKNAYPNLDLTQVFLKPLENVTSGQIPDLEKIKWRLLNSSYASPNFKNGIFLLIGSELAKGIIPSKWTSLGHKVGQGLAVGAVIASLGLGKSPAGEPHSSGSYNHSSGGNSPSWSYQA